MIALFLPIEPDPDGHLSNSDRFGRDVLLGTQSPNDLIDKERV